MTDLANEVADSQILLQVTRERDEYRAIAMAKSPGTVQLKESLNRCQAQVAADGERIERIERDCKLIYTAYAGSSEQIAEAFIEMVHREFPPLSTAEPEGARASGQKK